MSIKTFGIFSPSFEETTFNEIIAYFRDKEEIGLDSETMGFDPYTVDLLCLQIGDYDNQFIIHPSNVHMFKDFLEQKVLLGHNLKFDLLFLYYYNIFPNRVYDSFLAESILYCGIKNHKKGLAAVAKERVGVDLDKSVRDNIWKEGLSDRVIEYSADDVKYLSKIKESQTKELIEKGLIKTLELENEFTLVLAYIEFCGFKLDKPAWEKKVLRQKKELEEKEEELNQYILDNNISKYIDYQGDLFSSTLKPSINWNSSKQVINLFEDLGINVEIKEKGVVKKSVDSKVITKQKEKFNILPIYLKYKELEKVVSTYGDNFISQINPITGRIHTRFKQIMDTGRISSGGKNKETKESYPNMQNLPSDSETRSCFIAGEGNVLIVSDYSG